MRLESSETMLEGKWHFSEEKMAADDVCQRINALVDSYLIKLGADNSGWDSLFKDPNDSRLWELTYPQSELHGGGPPCLVVIEGAIAKKKYGDIEF